MSYSWTERNPQVPIENRSSPLVPLSESIHHELARIDLGKDEGGTADTTWPCGGSDRFLCTICVDEPESPLDEARLPACAHTFCLPCLASWSLVRQVCPNCKAPFETVLSRRSLQGTAVQGPPTAQLRFPQLEHPVCALRDTPWLPLREIHSPQHDIEASFELPPRNSAWVSSSSASASASASSGSYYHYAEYAEGASAAPHYLHEDVEDELEDRFWREEEQAHQHLMRTMSNRRHGPAGYMAAGRMRATPRPNMNGRNSSRGKTTAVAAAPSSGFDGALRAPKNKPKTQQRDASNSSQNAPGAHPGRKKKKKKERTTGVGAAAAKAAAAEKAKAKANKGESKSRQSWET